MELFIVIELQKNGEQLGNIVTSHTTLQEAQHKFYTVAAAAAISNIEKKLKSDEDIQHDFQIFTERVEQ